MAAEAIENGEVELSRITVFYYRLSSTNPSLSKRDVKKEPTPFYTKEFTYNRFIQVKEKAQTPGPFQILYLCFPKHYP